MQIATYVIYELLIRMKELNPDIGDFISCKRTQNGILVQTTSAPIMIPETIYQQQFENPSAISTIELLSLI